MRNLSNYTAQLYNSSERLRTLVSMLSIAINRNEQKKRQRADNFFQVTGAIVAVVLLCVGLPPWFPDGWKPVYTPVTGPLVIIAVTIVLLVVLSFKCKNIFHFIKDIFKDKSQIDVFQRYVRYIWKLADYTNHKYEREPRKQPPLPPALDPPPPNWFDMQWNNRRADGIDRDATKKLELLWNLINADISKTNLCNNSAKKDKGLPKIDKWLCINDEINEQMLQMRLLKHLIHLFILRPDSFPLPRALCILRYKSTNFLPKPTVSAHEFQDALRKCGYSDDQIEALHYWLNQHDNQQWIKESSIPDVAEALTRAGITTPPTVKFPTKKNLSQYSLPKSLPKLKNYLSDSDISLERKFFIYQDIYSREEGVDKRQQQALQDSIISDKDLESRLNEWCPHLEVAFISHIKEISQ